MNKIEKLKKSKNLTLLEVYNLLCDYNYKYKKSQERISKKDFREYTFLLWLKNKLLQKECNELLQASKKINTSNIKSITQVHNKVKCNNDKMRLYKLWRNDCPYYIDFFGLDVDYTKRKYIKKNKTKKQKGNTKIVNELSQKELSQVKTLSRLLKENQTYNKLKSIR